MEMFDVSSYVTPTRFNALTGVYLARALLDAAPPSPSARLRSSLGWIREAGETLRGVARERMRSSPRNLKPLDLKLDSGWVSLREILEAHARLADTERGRRAASLLRKLFQEGTSFVRFAYREQWAASQLHLERIEEEDLAGAIAELAGDGHVAYIRSAHEAFGDAMGLRPGAPDLPDTAALQKASTELAHAIAEYGRIMAGELDRTDPESVATFKRAMAPVDEHRELIRPRSEDEQPEPEVDLDEPMPEIEPPTA
ncbi:MAG: hypothetical protein RID94_02245 [Miltoncostaeaceae bacterium]